MSATARIREKAAALGFERTGVATIAPLDAARHWAAWIAAGMHGGMDWLAQDDAVARRGDPERILAGLKSVVCVALCHDPARDPERDARLGRIAR